MVVILVTVAVAAVADTREEELADVDVRGNRARREEDEPRFEAAASTCESQNVAHMSPWIHDHGERLFLAINWLCTPTYKNIPA